jgi:hypothetical protein
MLFCLSTKILHILREERRQSTIVALVRIHKYHIWETWEGHTKKSLSFILKILQNSRMKIDWRIWDIVLDLIILSFNYSRLKWRLQAPWLKLIRVSLKVRIVYFYSNPKENSCLNACVPLRCESIEATPDPFKRFAKGLANVKLGGVADSG